MTKRIMTMFIVMALALGGTSALAEPTATATADAETATTETTAAEAITTVEEADAIEGKTRYVAASPCLNIRVSADLEAEIVTTRHFNHTVKVIGEEGKWSHVLIVRGDQVFEGYCWTACLSDQKIVVKKAVKDSDDDTRHAYYVCPWDPNAKWDESQWQEHLAKLKVYGERYWEKTN